MLESQRRVCEYSSDKAVTIETMDDFLQKTVPPVSDALDEFSRRYASQVAGRQALAVCRHRKRRISTGYKITRTGYLKAVDIRLETPTLKVDPDIDDQEDEFFRSGAVFLDEKASLHIVEYYNAHNGYYAVDRGVFTPEQVAIKLAIAYADRVGIHSNYFIECFNRKLSEAKGFFRLS